MNSKFVLTFILVCLFQLNACGLFDTSGSSKEAYLSEYRSWMDNVEEICGDVSIKPDDEIWEETDILLSEFTGKQYRQFYPELSFKERLEISKFPVLYYLCRYKTVVDERVKLEFRGEIDTLVRGLTEIMDSTATIYKDYNSGIRESLQDFKSRSER